MLKHKLVMLSLAVTLAAPMAANATYKHDRQLERDIAGEIEMGEKTDHKKLFNLYTKQAAAGSAKGQVELGKAYAYGLGTKQSGDKAFEWVSKAANQSNVEALMLLGEWFDPQNEGVKGVSIDKELSLKMYLLAGSKSTEAEIAANKDNVGFAIESLAQAYERGEGVKQLGSNALEFYRILSTVEGRESALINIGDIHREGKIAPKDYTKAMAAYKKAAQYESTFGAEYKVGEMYYNGEGVAKDNAQAFEWFRRAAVDGDADGYIAIGKMFASGTGVAKSKTVAKDWFNSACELGNQQGCALAK